MSRLNYAAEMIQKAQDISDKSAPGREVQDVLRISKRQLQELVESYLNNLQAALLRADRVILAMSEYTDDMDLSHEARSDLQHHNTYCMSMRNDEPLSAEEPKSLEQQGVYERGLETPGNPSPQQYSGEERKPDSQVDPEKKKGEVGTGQDPTEPDPDTQTKPAHEPQKEAFGEDPKTVDEVGHPQEKPAEEKKEEKPHRKPGHPKNENK